jgi:hypothetical protein
MEISGHDTGTDWTVVCSLPAVEFQAVTIWLAVWFWCYRAKITKFFAQQLRPFATNVPL